MMWYRWALDPLRSLETFTGQQSGRQPPLREGACVRDAHIRYTYARIHISTKRRRSGLKTVAAASERFNDFRRAAGELLQLPAVSTAPLREGYVCRTRMHMHMHIGTHTHACFLPAREREATSVSLPRHAVSSLACISSALACISMHLLGA